MVLYYMMPEEILAFDAVRRKVSFEGPCPLCGGYESITGAYPVFLKSPQPMGPGFYRSDIPFASGKAKHPLLTVIAAMKGVQEGAGRR